MHELSITQTLLDLVLEQAKENEAQRVERIHLSSGR